MTTNRRQFPPDPRIAARLRIILEYHGVSATDLARAIGVTPSAVSQWLHGTTALSDQNAQRIADALGEEVDFVMCRKNAGKSGAGAAFRELAIRLGGDRIKQLLQMEDENLRRLIDEVLESRPKRSTKPPKKPR